ncbi:hypothetical protein [Streptomyces sp. NPDC101150]|uniref:hypothetical protein n=1 Tax=Streptomyces sp. NPDC101150 TaxID=3366114 RepID=UPI003829510D
MRKTATYAVLPALTAASLLVAGCSAGSSGPSAAGSADGKEPVAAATRNPDPQPPLAVASAPTGATPSAVATPKAGGKPAAKSSLKVAEFDKRSGRAVISRPTAATPPKSKEATPKPAAPIAVGDVIASAPAPGAPQGVLARVTEVVGTTGKGTEVKTTRANLGSLLGGSTAKGQVPVDPSAVKVEPLAPKVKVSWAKTGGLHFGPEGARLPLGSLRVDVSAALPTVKGSAGSVDASASGFVQLAPEVDFSYDGKGLASGTPGTASLSLAGDWSSQWELKGRAAASTTDGKPLRVPFAKLHADPVIQVGAVPVVVNLDLTCYLQVDADGKVSVDVKQKVKGDFRVGGSYNRAKGWTPIAKARMNGTPVTATATAAGKVKVSLGAEASIGLYGSVGVTGTVAPYLRAEVAGTATGASDGTASATGRWAAFGGVDLSGALWTHLDIFGTPIFERSIPLGPLNREWKLAGGKGTVRTPTKRS